MYINPKKYVKVNSDEAPEDRSVVDAVIVPLDIIPTRGAQRIDATDGINGFNPVRIDGVNYRIDENIRPENIKLGVNILGIVGRYRLDGIPKVKSDGVLSNSGELLDLTGVNEIDTRALMYAYNSNDKISGEIDLSGVKVISGFNACYNAFSQCHRITSVNLSGLEVISGETACGMMFDGCENITTVNINSLREISGAQGAYRMFGGTGLQEVNFPMLSVLTGYEGLSSAFLGCGNLTKLSFPALNSNSFGNKKNQFHNMLNGVSGCTVHFPSNLQSVIGSWSDVVAGFGGTNTTVLFDLPATE